MIAFKFLRAGRVAPFSGRVWPEPGGSWVEAAGDPSLCANGIHACRVGGLPYWIAEELWLVELDGAIVEEELKVAGQRGRLVEQVAAWDRPSQMRFADWCLRRVAWHAAAELRSAGLASLADALDAPASSGTSDELSEAAARVASAAAEGPRAARYAARLAEYVTDAAGWLDDAPGVAFVAAHAADARTSPEDQADPFRGERALQAHRLREQLRLDAV